MKAEEARKRTAKNYRPKKWNILDQFQWMRIEVKIYFWSRFGRDYIHFWDPRPLVRKKLEEDGFMMADYGGGCSPYPVITWKEKTK